MELAAELGRHFVSKRQFQELKVALESGEGSGSPKVEVIERLEDEDSKNQID